MHQARDNGRHHAPSGKSTIDLPLTPGRVARALGAFVALVVLAGVAGEVSRLVFDRGRAGGVVPLFNLDAEGNVPSFVSALLLVFAGLVVVLIARHRAERGLPHARAVAVLAGVLVFLGVDEATQIHELLSEPLRDALGLGGALYYAWVVAYGAAALTFVAVFAPKLRHVARDTRRLLTVAATTYLVGALGFELLGSAYIDATGADDGVYATLTTVEETLELGALVVLVYTVLRALERQAGSVTVRLLAASSEAPPPAVPNAYRPAAPQAIDGTRLLADRLARVGARPRSGAEASDSP